MKADERAVRRITLPIAELVESDAAFDSLRACATSYETKTEQVTEDFWQEASELKKRFVESGDDHSAKAVWCFETIARAQDHFLMAYDALQHDRFYDAWIVLERCELELGFLRSHYTPRGDKDPFGIRHVERFVPLLQELFPYRYFMSPAYVVREACCSICGAPSRLRSDCGHRKGEIYGGEMCARRITKGEFLETSLVTNPVQKYSILIGPRYDYGLVRYVARGLVTPWATWRCVFRTLPDRRTAGRNDPCPCGSGKKYKRCCLNATGTRMHADVEFGEPPPTGYPVYLEQGSFWQDESSSLAAMRQKRTDDESSAE
jgi:hypothetical protein